MTKCGHMVIVQVNTWPVPSNVWLKSWTGIHSCIMRIEIVLILSSLFSLPKELSSNLLTFQSITIKKKKKCSINCHLLHSCSFYCPLFFSNIFSVSYHHASSVTCILVASLHYCEWKDIFFFKLTVGSIILLQIKPQTMSPNLNVEHWLQIYDCWFHWGNPLPWLLMSF